MKSNEYKDYVTIFKALSDETRLKIVEIVSCKEMCACDILDFFQISQSTLSYHMKILTESNLVSSRKEGSWVRYSINSKLISQIKTFWNNITIEQDDCICRTSINKNKCN